MTAKLEAKSSAVIPFTAPRRSKFRWSKAFSHPNSTPYPSDLKRLPYFYRVVCSPWSASSLSCVRSLTSPPAPAAASGFAPFLKPPRAIAPIALFFFAAG
jgi:hypothetical protein